MKITVAYGETFKSKNEKGNYFRIDISTEEEFHAGDIKKFMNSQFDLIKSKVQQFKEELI